MVLKILDESFEVDLIMDTSRTENLVETIDSCAHLRDFYDDSRITNFCTCSNFKHNIILLGNYIVFIYLFGTEANRQLQNYPFGHRITATGKGTAHSAVLAGPSLPFMHCLLSTSALADSM